MRRKSPTLIACGMISAIGAIGVAGTASASFEFGVVGGQTSVLLDTETLAAAANLNLSGVSSGVIAPGELGPNSVAFGINPTTAGMPTTFAYDNGFTAFGGTIEHTGSVFFNDDTIEVGNFSIAFDENRVSDTTSGFFVASTTGIEAILFDIGVPSSLTADGSGLMIEADLLVSSEFSAFLLDIEFADADLTGAVVGSALVNATIPAPGALALLGMAGLAGRGRRRRS